MFGSFDFQCLLIELLRLLFFASVFLNAYQIECGEVDLGQLLRLQVLVFLAASFVNSQLLSLVEEFRALG